MNESLEELQEEHRKLSRKCADAKTTEALDILLEQMAILREKIKCLK